MQPTDLLNSYMVDSWEALSRLQHVNSTLSVESEAHAELQVLTHRLKGTAALYGFNQIASLAELAERLLEHSERLPKKELKHVEDFLEQVAACIYDGLCNIAKGKREGDLGLEFSYLGGSRILQGLIAQYPNVFVRRVAHRLEVQKEATSLPEALHAFRQANPTIWETFETEAFEHCEAILDTLEKIKKSKAKRTLKSGLSTLFRATHTLKGAAYLENLNEIGDLAHHLEDLMIAVREEKLEFSKELQQVFHEGVSALQLSLKSAVDLDLSPESALDKVHLKISQLLGDSSNIFVSTQIQEDVRHFCESNPDIWEYFAPEVHEHLEALGTALNTLSLQDADAAQITYRAFHTLKGSASMVGFPHMSDLAHGLEKLAAGVKEQTYLADDALPFFNEARAILSSMMLTAESKNLLPDSAVHSLQARVQILLSNDTTKPTAQTPTKNEPTSSTIRVGLDKLDTIIDKAGELISSRSRMLLLLESFSDLSRTLTQSRIRLNRTAEDFNERHFDPNLQGSSPEDNASTGKMNLTERFAELESDSYSDLNSLVRSVTEMASDLSAVQNQFDSLGATLAKELDDVRKLTRSLRGEISRIRMVPMSTLYTRLERMLRDLDSDKAFRLELSGECVEVDNAVLEAVADAMLHLLKNALVHGIEPVKERKLLGKSAEGVIHLNAYYQGNNVFVEVRDDGRGIDLEALKVKAVEKGLGSVEAIYALNDHEALELIFLEGLSTAKIVTKDAGRGVGMDAVKASIQKLTGNIEISSQPGKGTKFTLSLPLTQLISEALLMQVGQQLIAFPANAIHTLRFVSQDAFSFEDATTVFFEDAQVEVADLRPFFGLDIPEEQTKALAFIETAGKQLAFIVDRFHRFEEVVVKSSGGVLDGLEYLAGVTVNSNDEVIPIFEPLKLFDVIRQGVTQVSPLQLEANTQTKLLLVDDSLSVRKMLGGILERAGYEVHTAVDGQDAIEQLRQTSFATVLTDLEMPRINGYELIDELRRQHDKDALPIIVMTTGAGSKHMDFTFELGANNYLTKPVNEAALLASLKIQLSQGGLVTV